MWTLPSNSLMQMFKALYPWLLPGRRVCGDMVNTHGGGVLQEDFLEETVLELGVMGRGFELLM